MKILSRTEKQTFFFAKKIAKRLKGGEIIGLIGDLGAGKTVFTKGLAAGLGIKRNIISPTFVLMRLYRVRARKIKRLVHIDAYRLKSAADLDALGWDEYFYRPDTVVVIEWADKIKKNLPPKTNFFALTYKKNSRLIKTPLA